MIKMLLVAAVVALVSCNRDSYVTSDLEKQALLSQKSPRLSDASWLRKASFHIRGYGPSAEEYSELAEATVENRLDQFKLKKIKEFLSSPEHVEKMLFRMRETLGLRAAQEFMELTYAPKLPYRNDVGGVSSLDYLILEVVKNNLSWDQLLLKKNYRVFPAGNRFVGNTDPDFFRALKPNEIPKHNNFKFIDIQFDPRDNRIAGLVTTSRFFRRHVTTDLNRNRKRAAAVFKTFLCDDMRAVATDQSGDTDAIADLVFPGTKSESEHGIRAKLNIEDPHGSDPACVKCHEKLDPLGQSFLNSPVFLSPKPNRGKLFYRRQNGPNVDAPGNGLGELAKVIVAQPEYVDCQVKRFWTWFIGENIPLAEQDLTELKFQFEQHGRRTNDFIEYLIHRPEFSLSARQTESEAMAMEVKRIFKACTQCHALNPSAQHIPDFTQWPIGQNMKLWVKKIERSTDIRNGAKDPMMPPPGTWKLKAAEIDLLIRWIDLGAPNERGESQI